LPESAVNRGHETRDLNVRVVTWFAVILVGATVLIFFAVIGLSRLFAHWHPSPDVASRIELRPQMLAPSPQLQVLPSADLERFRAQEEAKLNSYGWVDQPAGVVRLPIARAMELIVQRGLPTRGSGTQDSSGITPEQMQQQKAAATASAKAKEKK